MINSVDIGKKIKACRDEKGLTQKELAESISITPQQLSSFENGKSVPTLENAVAIANKLNISLDELTGNEVQTKDKKYTCYDYVKMLDLLFFLEQQFPTVATVEYQLDGTPIALRTEKSAFYAEDYFESLSLGDRPSTESIVFRATEPRVVKYFKDWLTMIQLRNTEVISDDLYKTWLKGEFDCLKDTLLSFEEACDD